MGVILNWEIDNGWVLFQKERIFCEPFNVQNDEWRQFCNFKTLHKTVLISFVLLFIDAIKFG